MDYSSPAGGIAAAYHSSTNSVMAATLSDSPTSSSPSSTLRDSQNSSPHALSSGDISRSSTPPLLSDDEQQIVEYARIFIRNTLKKRIFIDWIGESAAKEATKSASSYFEEQQQDSEPQTPIKRPSTPTPSKRPSTPITDQSVKDWKNLNPNYEKDFENIVTLIKAHPRSSSKRLIEISKTLKNL